MSLEFNDLRGTVQERVHKRYSSNTHTHENTSVSKIDFSKRILRTPLMRSNEDRACVGVCGATCCCCAASRSCSERSHVAHRSSIESPSADSTCATVAPGGEKPASVAIGAAHEELLEQLVVAGAVPVAPDSDCGSDSARDVFFASASGRAASGSGIESVGEEEEHASDESGGRAGPVSESALSGNGSAGSPNGSCRWKGCGRVSEELLGIGVGS